MLVSFLSRFLFDEYRACDNAIVPSYCLCLCHLDHHEIYENCTSKIVYFIRKHKMSREQSLHLKELYKSLTITTDHGYITRDANAIRLNPYTLALLHTCQCKVLLIRICMYILYISY